MSDQLQEPDETRRENETEFVDAPSHESHPDPAISGLSPTLSHDHVEGGEYIGEEAELASHAPPTTLEEGMVNQSPPPIDPSVGEVANEEVTQARRDVEVELTGGEMTLEDVFEQSDTERDEASDHRVIGHMHIRAALMALPHIGELRTNDILREVEIEGDTHIDALGENQRQEILDLVEAWDV